MGIQSAYQVEQTKLRDTYSEIERQLSGIGPRYYGDDFVEQVLDAKREEKRQRLELLKGEPYFGRLDFQEAGKPESLPLYIGKRGMEHEESGRPHIIDWRAPVASLFYSFTGGDEQVEYEAPDGSIAGEIHLKRNLSIREQELQRVVDSYVRGGDNLGLSDEFLLYRLGEKKDNRLRDIVSTIQAEQDRIIRAPRNAALIIQGAAGSGKTTVALHRLAFLLYQYQEQMRPERMIIFAPNMMFLDYISGVLPELGVGDVQQTTFNQWALDLLGGTVKLMDEAPETGKWFALEGVRPAIDERTPSRYKGSLAFKAEIETALAKLEATYLQVDDFEAWGGAILPVSTVREWFEVEYRHYPLAMRRERLIARINRWLEMQLGEIGDPKIRKERSKTGRQKMKTYVRKLPAPNAIAFYAGLYGFAEPHLRKGLAKAEDLAPLVWIHRHLHGPEGVWFDHVVVDEAQDASPFQIALLNAFMREPSFTILGDLAQGIHAYRGISRWQEFEAVFEVGQSSYHELTQSYRSTLEIIEFANRILPFTGAALKPAQPVFRSGEAVSVIELDRQDERGARVEAFIRESMHAGMRTIAVIGRSGEDCASIAEELARRGLEASLIAEGQSQYRGGVSVVPVYLSKGLEFDAVLVLDADSSRYTATEADAKLLYVGTTRALHRLTLLYTQEITPLVAG